MATLLVVAPDERANRILDIITKVNNVTKRKILMVNLENFTNILMPPTFICNFNLTLTGDNHCVLMSEIYFAHKHIPNTFRLNLNLPIL